MTTNASAERNAVYELAYDEARRALDHQVSALEGLRGRIAQVLAGITAATAFFGGVVLAIETTSLWRFVAAVPIALYVASAWIGFDVLKARDWTSTMDPQVLIEGYAEGDVSLADTHRHTALYMKGYWDSQEVVLKGMGTAFQKMTKLAIGAIVAWAGVYAVLSVVA